MASVAFIYGVQIFGFISSESVFYFLKKFFTQNPAPSIALFCLDSTEVELSMHARLPKVRIYSDIYAENCLTTNPNTIEMTTLNTMKNHRQQSKKKHEIKKKKNARKPKSNIIKRCKRNHRFKKCFLLLLVFLSIGDIRMTMNVYYSLNPYLSILSISFTVRMFHPRHSRVAL